MVYVGWIIFVLVIVFFGFFVILYSMEFGKMKLEEWLLMFVFLFVELLFVFDLINVRIVFFKFKLLYFSSVVFFCINLFFFLDFR